MDRPEYLWSTEGLLSMITILLALVVVNLTAGAPGLTAVISLLTALAIAFLVIGRLLFTDTVGNLDEEGEGDAAAQPAEGEAAGGGS